MDEISRKMLDESCYLGDGAYVFYGGYEYIFFTHNGIRAQDIIHLEHSAIEKFLNFKKEKESNG
jgi:hypothetical protein